MPYRIGHTDGRSRERWISGEADQTRGCGLERLCRLQTAIREARGVLADLDDTPPSNMDLMFYMQAYDVLHLHLEELLAALPERIDNRSPDFLK